MIPALLSGEPGRDEKFRTAFLIATVAAGVLFAIVFTAFPGLDLEISAALRDACGGDDRYSGWCHENGVLSVPRYAAMVFSVLLCGAALVALVRPAIRNGGAWSAQRMRCAFLLAAFVIGPGLVANIALKDHWGRARPREVVEFGGARHFTPPLVPTNQCHDNCSFVSGEAASTYLPFFAAALIAARLRLALLATGIVAGTLVGLVRMSTGGHFLSDILFAGVFMALTASLLHAVVTSAWTRISGRTALDPLDPYSLTPWPLGSRLNIVEGK